MKSVVSEKGQVTIPKPIRVRLGITQGAILEFREEAGSIVVTKAGDETAVASVYGILDVGRTVDDLVEEMRGRPPDATAAE